MHSTRELFIVGAIKEIIIVWVICGTFAWCVGQGFARYDATLAQQACESTTEVAIRAARIGMGIGADETKRREERRRANQRKP